MTTKRKIKPTKPIHVDFVCLECDHGYRTQLPREIVSVVKRAWGRIHWADNGCKLKGDLS